MSAKQFLHVTVFKDESICSPQHFGGDCGLQPLRSLLLIVTEFHSNCFIIHLFSLRGQEKRQNRLLELCDKIKFGAKFPSKDIQWCDPLTLQPEQSGGVGSRRGRALTT